MNKPHDVPMAAWLRHPSNQHLRAQLPALYPELFIRESDDGFIEILRSV